MVPPGARTGAKVGWVAKVAVMAMVAVARGGSVVEIACEACNSDLRVPSVAVAVVKAATMVVMVVVGLVALMAVERAGVFLTTEGRHPLARHLQGGYSLP